MIREDDYMGKKSVLMLGVLMSLSIAACGGTSNVSNGESDSIELESTEKLSTNDTDVSETVDDLNETESAPDETEAAEAEEIIYNIGETAQLKDWEITVTDMKVVDSISADYGVFNPNDEGNKYAQVFVTVENKGKESGRFLPSFGFGDDVGAKMLYGDGYEFVSTQLLGYNNDLHDSSINPLSSQSGEIAFEISETVANATDELLINFYSGNDAVSFKVR